MKLTPILHKITHSTLPAAAAALLCAGAWGCSDGNTRAAVDEPAATPGETAAPADRDVWLSLRVNVPVPATAGGGSRADDAAGHPEEDATADECHIDRSGNNLSLMFFDDRQMLWRVLNPQEMVVEPVAGSTREYVMRFKINSAYFSYAGTEGDVECSYMLVANLGGTGGGDAFSTNDLFAMTPAQIAARHAGFDMPDQSAATWMPSAADGRHIPMSGIARCTISRENFNNSTVADMAADMGTLYLQRALAKVRILDAVPLQQDVDFDRITAVSLVGGNTRGAYIPEGTPAWYAGTVDVETATERPEWFDPDCRIRMFNTEQTSTVENRAYQNAFVCYVPECKLTGRQPRMIITVKKKNSTATRDFEVVLSQPSGSFGGLTSLARNHIYEFKVEMSTTSQLQLNYTVCDWDRYTVNPPTFQ